MTSTVVIDDDASNSYLDHRRHRGDPLL